MVYLFNTTSASSPELLQLVGDGVELRFDNKEKSWKLGVDTLIVDSQGRAVLPPIVFLGMSRWEGRFRSQGEGDKVLKYEDFIQVAWTPIPYGTADEPEHPILQSGVVYRSALVTKGMSRLQAYSQILAVKGKSLQEVPTVLYNKPWDGSKAKNIPALDFKIYEGKETPTLKAFMAKVQKSMADEDFTTRLAHALSQPPSGQGVQVFLVTGTAEDAQQRIALQHALPHSDDDESSI